MLKKTTKRFISAVMIVAMVTLMLPFAAFAYETTTSGNSGSSTGSTTTWDGTTAETNWYDTNSDSYTISTAAQLAGLAKLVNEGKTFSGKTITLGADIDLGGKEWTPIGTVSNKFQGTFDGNRKTISNLKITRGLENIAQNNNIGFFGVSTSSAKIQNFTLNNVNVSGNLNIAAVLGGSGFAEAKIDNVHVTGNVQISGW